MFQPFTYHPICSQQVRRGYSLAIRRVGHDDALFFRTFEVGKVGLTHSYVVSKSRSSHIKTRGVHGLNVDVVSVNMVCELTFLRVVVVDGVEKFSIIIGPLLECKFLAEHARTHVVGNKGSLYGKCT